MNKYQRFLTDLAALMKRDGVSLDFQSGQYSEDRTFGQIEACFGDGVNCLLIDDDDHLLELTPEIIEEIAQESLDWNDSHWIPS